SGNHVRSPAGAIRRPCVELVVGGEVVAYNQVIRWAGLGRQQGCNDDSMRRGVGSKQEEAIRDAEAGTAVVNPGILGHRRNVVDALRIATGVVKGVGTVQRQMAELGIGGHDDLMLLVDAAGLKLIVIRSRKRADDCVRGWIEFRRGYIV